MDRDAGLASGSLPCCDLYLVGKRPFVAHLDGDDDRLCPGGTGADDGRRPGQHAGRRDVGGQGIGDDRVQVRVAGVGEAEGVAEPRLRSRFLDAALCHRVPNGSDDYRQGKNRTEARD